MLEAIKKIKRQADIFSAVRETKGQHYELACQAVEEGVLPVQAGEKPSLRDAS